MKDNMFKIRDFYCKYVKQDSPNFCVSEKYKNEMLQVDVFIKKEEEFKKVHTVVTSKKDNEKEIKDFVEKVMCHEIGNILDDGTVEKEFFRQGYIYKNYENFYKREVKCYVAEFEEETNISNVGISYDGIYEEVCDYLLQCGVNIIKVPEKEIEAMVEDIFENVDWQHTCSLIQDEYLQGYVEDFPNEYFFENEKNQEREEEVL